MYLEPMYARSRRSCALAAVRRSPLGSWPQGTPSTTVQSSYATVKSMPALEASLMITSEACKFMAKSYAWRVPYQFTMMPRTPAARISSKW